MIAFRKATTDISMNLALDIDCHSFAASCYGRGIAMLIEARKGQTMGKQRLVVEYMGESIMRNTCPGYALRWSCLGYGAADTLQGMKALIREAKGRT